MTGIVGALDAGTGAADIPVWVGIPTGYFTLPLDDVPGYLERAESVLTDVADDAQKPQIRAVIGVLSVFLTDLAASGALYCGIGRHTSPTDQTVVTSSLVVSYQEYQGTRNPRLLLNDLLQAKADADERGQADLVEVLGRPTLFFERSRQLPTPQIPGQPAVPEGATTRVYQLEAFVPSEKGDKLAVIELSTPFETHGPEYRAMVVQMAASVSFEPPALPSEARSKISQLLG
ncbi:hypothetical protein [Gandjariella thermophila]|uniref:Uncharacterized protein n=1 Tax=Gandjariella thermophila TaxID=1931992 RepID=A0A4D4JEI1_9PSEU|nr:hypothetical protein [Gandjariella thermophila]GDY34064.1 hypothetical protein GTS_56970 [Gandjariella thermophila]